MLKLKLINKPQLFKLKCNFSFPDVVLGKMQEKTIIPSKEELEVSPDSQYDGLSKVIVKKIPDEYIIPTGNIDIVENGTYDIKDKASANVNVPVKILGTKTIIVNGTYKATDDNFDGYSQVDVNVPLQGWKPNSTWWDIDKILEEDTEPYPGKFIVLYSDINKTTHFTYGKPNEPYPQKIKTSDGAEYTYSETSSYSYVTHTWDKTKDKISNLEYGTRYAIYYFDNSNSTGMQIDKDRSKLYVIVDNIKVFQGNVLYSDNPFYNCYNLESVKFQNGGSLGKNGNYNYQYSFYGCYALRDLSTLNLSDPITDLRYFYGSTSLEEIPEIDTSQATRLDYFAIGNRLLKKIKTLNGNATIYNWGIYTCANLSIIENISNIKLNFDVNGSPLLSHDTLIRILNALVDLTGQTSKTLTLGTINKTKLTDNELEIATSKNWVVN